MPFLQKTAVLLNVQGCERARINAGKLFNEVCRIGGNEVYPGVIVDLSNRLLAVHPLVEHHGQTLLALVESAHHTE
jgi:hypothetical protein